MLYRAAQGYFIFIDAATIYTLTKRYVAMKFVSCSLLLCSALSGGIAHAQEAPRQDGVNVGNMSWARKFGGSGLEQQAALQYAQVIQDARQKRALGPDDFSQVVRLRSIANKLIPYTLSWNPRSKNWKWEINLLGSKQINAYCMPGGKIAFYSGILDTLKLTDDEIAIVMGHEIAHALREHGAERAGKANILNFMVQGTEVVAGLKGYDPRFAGALAGSVAKVGMLALSYGKRWRWSINLHLRSGYRRIPQVITGLLKFRNTCLK